MDLEALEKDWSDISQMYPANQAFVVQFPAENTDAAVRVRIEHVTSGRSVQAGSVAELLAFLKATLADEGAGARTVEFTALPDLRLLTETIPHMLWSATPDGMVDYVNQRVLDYARLPYEAFLRSGWGQAIHPDHLPQMTEAWATSVRTGEPFQFEFLGRHAPTDSWRWCVSSALPARGDDGRIIKWYGSIVDLHDRKRVEEVRLQAEQQYRTVVETATDAVVAIDEHSTIILINPAVTKMFGYRAEDVVGKPLTMLMPRDLAARHVEGLREYARTGTRHVNWDALAAVAIRANGETFPVEISFAEVTQDGRRAFIGFIRDVTERRQAEDMRAAQARQADLRADVTAALAGDGTLRDMLQACAEALVKHLGAALARIWVIDEAQTLELQASAGLYTHLDGAHARIPVGRLKIGLIAQERGPHVTNNLLGDGRISDPDWARREGLVAFAGYPLLAGGRVIGVMATFSRAPITPATGNTLGAVADALAQGIQRKQAEERTRRSEAFLAEAQALSQTGSWGWNTATGDVFWSRETFRIFGLDPAVTPRLPMIADLIHPDDRPQFEMDAERLARERTDIEREYRLVLPDASHKCVHVVGKSVPGTFADLDVIGSVMDVTGRKHAEEALLAAQADLADVTRLMTMGELAASIAHEINQPLATVVTNAQACSRLLRAEAPQLDEVAAAISDIADAGRRASDVIGRIRLLLRKGMPQPTALDVNDVVKEVVLLTRDDTNRRRVLLKTDLAGGLPHVYGDRVQLQQVLINLMTNAIDAMSDVQASARVMTVRTRRLDAGRIEVAVVDSGTGIDSKHQARLFDPFFTTKPEGMGMGLAICRNIVEASGGSLSAANNPGGGATVTFVLPVRGIEDP